MMGVNECELLIPGLSIVYLADPIVCLNVITHHAWLKTSLVLEPDWSDDLSRCGGPDVMRTREVEVGTRGSSQGGQDNNGR